MIDNIRTFLNEKARVAYLSTIDLQGFPHTVPIWFAVDGDDLISSATHSRVRVKHIQSNAKGAIAVGGNTDDREGYLIKGEIRIEADATHVLLMQIIEHYMDEDGVKAFLARAQNEERIILRLTPTKVISV